MRRVTAAEAVCQEFCEHITVEEKIENDSRVLFRTKRELKCELEDIKYFSELASRMVDIGYCCTQVQEDLRANKCVAWFEEESND